MMHIIRGSQVRVNFSMVAFSHSDVSNMHAYDGMPCLLDIIAGTGMILNALDLAILSMEVGEERDIVVPAVESAHTARILGINIRGCLMYKLKVLQVVNTPVGCAEVEDFLSKSCVSLHDLSEIKSVKKGPFKIERSYDMFEANAISAQYRILESLYKEHMTKDTPSSLSSSDNQTSSSSSLHDSFNGNNAAEFISKIHVNSIKYKTINPESCNSNSSGRCSSTLSDNKSNATFGYSESESCGDFRMNGNVQYVLPSWPLNQPKELFLPELFRIAVAKQTRIIILFDKLEDWDTINELINIERSKAVLRDIESHRNRGSKGGPYHNTGHNSGQTSATTYQSGGAVIEAEVEMAVESEEVDSTGETILTWLRVATESTSTANAAATNTAESTCTDTKTDTNTDAMSSGSSADNKDAVRKHSTSNSTTPSDFTANQGNADDKIVSSINIISGIPTGQDPYGYRVALIRFCGWDRGAPPQKRLWDGFWKMYMRVINEVSAATLGQPVSVLLVDVGAAIGGRKSKNKEEETHTSSDNLTQNSIQHLGEIENNGNQRRSEVCWGIGDRVCVFIVVCRLLHILAVMKSDRAKLKVIADSERDVEGECEREDEDGTIDYFEEDVRTGQSLFTKYVLKASSDVSTVQDPHSSTSSFPDLSAEEISAKLLADSKIIIAKVDREMMEERVKAKARLACRLRARETRPSTTTSTFTALPVSNGDQNGSSNSNEVSNDNYSSNNNDNCNDDNESTVKEDGSGTIVCDNGDTVCADNTNQNLYESQASPPHHSHTLTHPFSPPPPPDLSGPNTVSSLPHSQSIPSPHPPHDVEKNSDQRIELTKVGNDSHLSPTQSDLICIPRMIYEIFSPESPHSPLSSLFVTHAQYKFIYKIACELTKD